FSFFSRAETFSEEYLKLPGLKRIRKHVQIGIDFWVHRYRPNLSPNLLTAPGLEKQQCVFVIYPAEQLVGNALWRDSRAFEDPTACHRGARHLKRNPEQGSEVRVFRGTLSERNC